jgi:two-component system KDP operon response regulator KdpE
VNAGPITINLAGRIVTRAGEEVKLTAIEFKLLACLAANADRVLTNQAILNHVWGGADIDHTEYVRVYIGQLRKKLEANPDQPRHLVTETGIGYRLLTNE